MATSYNGYEVIPDYGDPRLVNLEANGKPFAPHQGILGGSVGIVMNYLANWIDTNIEPLDINQAWSFQPKQVTGGSGWSCHASGTAFDFNAQKHPWGADDTWTPDQISRIDAFLYNVLEGSVRWGEHYTLPTKRDGMHYEVMAVLSVMDRIAAKIQGLGTITPPPPSSPSNLDWISNMTAAQEDAFAKKIADAVWSHLVGNGGAGATLEEIRKVNRDINARTADLVAKSNKV